MYAIYIYIYTEHIYIYIEHISIYTYNICIYICTYIYIHTYVGQNNAEKNQKNTPPIYIYTHVCVWDMCITWKLIFIVYNTYIYTYEREIVTKTKAKNQQCDLYNMFVECHQQTTSWSKEWYFIKHH